MSSVQGIDISLAPRVWRENRVGAKVRVIDPRWLATARERQAEKEARRVRRQAAEQARVESIRRHEDHRRAEISAWYRAAHRVIDDDPPRLKSQPIIAEIADFHGVTVAAIKGDRRHRKVTVARFHAVYEVARLCPHLTLPKIGAIFDRDHTTILHALREWPERARRLGIPCAPIGEPIKGAGGRHHEDRG